MSFNSWVSPYSKEVLEYDEATKTYKIAKEEYPIIDGIIDFTYPKQLAEKDQEAKSFYESRADSYDTYLHLTFETHGEDETVSRNKMIDLLDIQPNSKILEISAGTGRDSLLINKRLDDTGELHITDLAFDMLKKAQRKLPKDGALKYFCAVNASYLPYPDNYFDALYSFGGLGEFANQKLFFEEAVRVCKEGAKIVVGDENLPIWQRDSLFGRILSNHNAQFLADVPFDKLPIQARDVRCQWVVGGVFYLIDFKVGIGEPYANFDYEIPGVRGGTHKTRYYGKLEGVTSETKELAYKAVSKTGYIS